MEGRVQRSAYCSALGLLAFVLFVLSMTLIPAIERLFLRDLFHRAEREGRKVEAVRE